MTVIARLIILLALALIGAAHAQTTLSPARLATACTACKADAACNTPRLAGDTITVLQWLNAPKTVTQLAWRIDLQPQEIDEAANYTTYDSLTAGKRDEWVLFLRYSRNMSKAKNRGVVTDVWGAATAGSVAESILQAATYAATNVQAAIGGTSRTTGTVTALDLTYTGAAASGDANWLVQSANCN